MIFELPPLSSPVDQVDVIDSVPLLEIRDFHVDSPGSPDVACECCRVLVLTQTCDLMQQKANRVAVAVVLDADAVVQSGLVKAADVRGPMRAGRYWGLYFLPAAQELGLPEMIVDFRQIHSVPRDVLEAMCQAGYRRARLACPYREHLAKHFADSYSRIGLPMPYETA